MNQCATNNRDVAAHWPILAPALVVYGAIAPTLQHTLAIVLALLGTKLLDAVGERHQPRLLFQILRPLPVFLSAFAFATLFFPSDNIGVGWMFAACGVCSLFICLSSDEARTMRFVVSILLTLLTASALAHFGGTESWNAKLALADAFLFFVMLELVRPHRSSLQQDSLFFDYLLSLTIAFVASFAIESWAIAACGALVPTVGFAIQNHRRSTNLQGRELDQEDPLQPMGVDKAASPKQPIGALALLSSLAASLAILLYLTLAFTPTWIDRVDTSIPLVRHVASTAAELAEQSKLKRPDTSRYVDNEQVRQRVHSLYQKLQQLRTQQRESPVTHKSYQSTSDSPTGSVPGAAPDASPTDDLASTTPASHTPAPSPSRATTSPSIAPVPADARSHRPPPSHARRQATNLVQHVPNGGAATQATTEPPPSSPDVSGEVSKLSDYARIDEPSQPAFLEDEPVPETIAEAPRPAKPAESLPANYQAPTPESPQGADQATSPSIASSTPGKPAPSSPAFDSLAVSSLYPPTIGSEKFTLDHATYRRSNDAVVMTVSLSPQSEAPTFLYLRSGILDTATPTGFQTEPRNSVTLPIDLSAGQTPAPAAFKPNRRTRNEITITARARLDGAIPMPESFTSIRVPGISRLAYHPGDRLVRTTDPYSNFAYHLKGVDFDNPPRQSLSPSAIAQLRQRLVELPLPPADKAELEAFAHRIVGKSPSSTEFAKAVSEHFRSNHPYSHDFAVPTGDRHPVVRWLQNDSSGICSHYTSAFTLLARSVGIPTRIVTGYLSYEYDSTQRRFIIRSENAHAWVEYLDESNKWVRFDPTPPDTSIVPQRPRSESLVEMLDTLAPVGLTGPSRTDPLPEGSTETSPTTSPLDVANAEETAEIATESAVLDLESARSTPPQPRLDESRLAESGRHLDENDTGRAAIQTNPSANAEGTATRQSTNTIAHSENPFANQTQAHKTSDGASADPSPSASLPSANNQRIPTPATRIEPLAPEASENAGAAKAADEPPPASSTPSADETNLIEDPAGSVHVPKLLIFLALILLLALGLPHFARSLTTRVQAAPETRHRSLAGKLLSKVEAVIREKELQQQPQWERLRADLLRQRYGRAVEPTALQRLSAQFKEQCAALSRNRTGGGSATV